MTTVKVNTWRFCRVIANITEDQTRIGSLDKSERSPSGDINRYYAAGIMGPNKTFVGFRTTTTSNGTHHCFVEKVTD